VQAFATSRLPSSMRAIARSPNTARLVSLSVVLAVWEFYGRQYPLFTSYPSEIAQAFVDTFSSEVLPALLTTLHGFAVGFAIAAPLGVALGLLTARSEVFDTILTPYINALYVTPRVTLIPLLVLWFGIGFELRVAIVVMSAIFPVIINVYTGARVIDHELMDVGRAFVANRWQLLRTIVVPGSLPYAFTGLRLGLARALTGIVVAEMSAAIAGLGRLLITKGRALQTDQLFVPIIVLGLLAIVLTAGLVALQRRAMPWQQEADRP